MPAPSWHWLNEAAAEAVAQLQDNYLGPCVGQESASQHADAEAFLWSALCQCAVMASARLCMTSLRAKGRLHTNWGDHTSPNSRLRLVLASDRSCRKWQFQFLCSVRLLPGPADNTQHQGVRVAIHGAFVFVVVRPSCIVRRTGVPHAKDLSVKCVGQFRDKGRTFVGQG